jgi:hypothetical protein
MGLGVLSGLACLVPALVVTAFDLQSWGDARAVGGAIPSIGVLARLALHIAALGFAFVAIVGGVYAVLRPRRAGRLLLVSAVGVLPLLDYFLAWNLKLGVTVPVLVPPLLLLIAAALLLPGWWRRAARESQPAM